MNDVYINRVGMFFPNDAVSNDELEAILGQAGERPSRARGLVVKGSGIQSRYYAVDPETGTRTHTNAQMTARAVENLTDADFEASDIECLVCGTSSPDQLQPSHAVMVHGELGTSPVEIASISGICVSGIQAIKYGYMSVLAGLTRNAVCTGSEVASAVMRGPLFAGEMASRVDELQSKPILAFEKDFLRWMLSDGAGAMLLSDRPNAGKLSFKIEWLDIHSFAGSFPVCMYQGAEKTTDGALTGYLDFTPQDWQSKSILSVKQDVRLLNENIVKVCVHALLRTVEKRGLDVGEIDYFLPHISSEYFRGELHQAYQSAGHEIPQSRWFTNLTAVGNIGSASIYAMLDELLRSGKLQPGNRLLLMVPESGRFTMSYALLSVVG